MRASSLFATTALILGLNGAAWSQQTYNPVDSDPTTFNTAAGRGALLFNGGSTSTALGAFTLPLLTTGQANVAVGVTALGKTTTGSSNTAVGTSALLKNISGFGNVGLGAHALLNSETGEFNTALGTAALNLSTLGSHNTAVGAGAMGSNTLGARNTAVGFNALSGTIFNSNSTAIGIDTLKNARGARNTAVGWEAGRLLEKGTDNIYLGALGAKEESNTMRLGGVPVKQTFIRGVAGVPITGVPVVINPLTGQLGVAVSAATVAAESAVITQMAADLQALREEVAALKAQLGK